MNSIFHYTHPSSQLFIYLHPFSYGFIVLPLIENERNPNMESLYDYGSRAGFWRYHRLFTSRKIPITVFAVGMVRATNQ